MTRRRLCIDAALAPPQRVRLDRERSSYLCRVLRLQAGAELRVFDGDGREYHARIATADRRSCELELIEALDPEPPPQRRLHLVQALIKSDPLDLVLQKATELGATDLWLVTSSRSEVRISSGRLPRRMRHWQGVIRAACEQSGRARLPELRPPQGLAEALPRLPVDTLLLLSPEAEPLTRAPSGNIALLVGPEGGFTEQERTLIEEAGATPLGLGPWTLRADTAPLAGLAVLRQSCGWRLS